MTAGVVRLGTDGRVWRSLVSFYSDVGRADAPVITLGVLVEAAVPSVRGLGMVARTTLSPAELQLAHEPARSLIERPFDYISDQFDQAWDDAPAGEALAYLARRHPHSLHFAAPQQLELPRRFLIAPPNDREVLTLMADLLDDESYDLATQGVPRRRLFELAEAA